MFLNRTTKYAISILAYLATEPERSYSSETLHQELNIPRRYLRLLLTDLSKHSFIHSSRGRNGGFCLCKNPQDISVAQVIDTMEGFEDYSTCFFGIKECKNSEPCAMHDVWGETRDKLIKKLNDTSLYDLGHNSIIKF